MDDFDTQMKRVRTLRPRCNVMEPKSRNCDEVNYLQKEIHTRQRDLYFPDENNDARDDIMYNKQYKFSWCFIRMILDRLSTMNNVQI